MEQASGKNLNQFFQQWLYRADNLKLKGNWIYDAAKKQLVVTLEQHQAGEYIFDVPVEIGVYTAGSTVPKIIKFRLNTKQKIHTIRLKVNPDKVIVDPRTVLLAQIDFN